MNLVLSNDNTKAFILEASFRVLVLYICQRNFCMSNAFPIVLKHNDLGEWEYSDAPLYYRLQIPFYNLSQDTAVVP